ncbi:hypothetical protein TRICHSKD4_5561 [Roseibium sp. TrichSKD4]|nr:hypothetical protein TRICHSKD4_5561 [Roseibium sp. TrichSKD4]
MEITGHSAPTQRVRHLFGFACRFQASGRLKTAMQIMT